MGENRARYARAPTTNPGSIYVCSCELQFQPEALLKTYQLGKKFGHRSSELPLPRTDHTGIAVSSAFSPFEGELFCGEGQFFARVLVARP